MFIKIVWVISKTAAMILMRRFLLYQHRSSKKDESIVNKQTQFLLFLFLCSLNGGFDSLKSFGHSPGSRFSGSQMLRGAKRSRFDMQNKQQQQQRPPQAYPVAQTQGQPLGFSPKNRPQGRPYNRDRVPTYRRSYSRSWSGSSSGSRSRSRSRSRSKSRSWSRSRSRSRSPRSNFTRNFRKRKG